MPVLKVKNNGVWEDVAGGAAAGPVDGGNADTLDGKHADEFASASDIEALQGLVGDTSVSTQIGDAINALTAADVGALPDDTVIPSIEGLATTDVATASEPGLMSSSDKVKLDTIEAGANNYTLPTATDSVLGGVKVGNGLAISNGTLSVDVVDNLISDSTTNPLSAAQGKALSDAINSITTDIGNLGGGDMLTATYDKDKDGIVDNSAKLEGHSASYFATTSALEDLDRLVGDSPVATQIETAINELNLDSKYEPVHDHPYINTNQKGVANGIAELDANGKVPSAQLPSYVDDVLEYSAQSSFPTTGETGKIYVDISTNKTYRWGGSSYVEISASLALGETSSTAYRGDYGKKSYEHSLIENGNPHGISCDTISAVPTSRTINGKALSANITLSASDVGADVAGSAESALTSAKSYTDSQIDVMVGDETVAAQIEAATDDCIIGLSINGKVITYTKGDGSTDSITTQDTNTVYTHPSYTAKDNGFYKVTVDGTGHVSGTAAVAKADITALGIPAQDTTYSAATTSAAGLMSAADKKKLDGIADGANKITIDSELSSTSTNPVQNKVVNSAISNLSTLVGDTKVSTQISNAIASKSDTGHTHDDRYYTESEIDTKLGGKSDTGHTHDYAAASHGNHVPATETANNAKFLRNDNSWQTVTPANIGAAAASHGTHVSYSTANPVVDGTASAGSADTVARSDHKHPTDTSRAAASDLTTLQGLVGDTKVSTQIANAISGKANSSDLAKVATSGSYADLSNKPTIPSAYSHPATHSVSMITGLATVATTGSYSDLSNKPNIPSAYSHPNSGVTAGTYKSVTVNAQGHVTAGSNPTTLSGYGITDAATKSELTSLVGDTKVSTQITNAINGITHPVTSVNGKTGNVILSASDVGAAATSHGSHIFFATMDETTFAEITAAFNAGNMIFCKKINPNGALIYPLTCFFSEDAALFQIPDESGGITEVVCDCYDSWTSSLKIPSLLTLSFTIDAFSCSAVRCMTWREWVDSGNNDVNAILNPNGRIVVPGYAQVAYDFGDYVDPDDMILARHYLFSA